MTDAFAIRASPFALRRDSFANPMLRRFAVLLALVLAACGGPRVSDYAAIEKVNFRANGMNWLVADNAAQSRLMITPSSDDFSQGLLREYNPPLLNIPQTIYQQAAGVWLRQNHEMPCQVVDGYVLRRPSWEFVYHCGLNAPAPPPPPRRYAPPPQPRQQPGTLPQRG
jgi:hypothetical protein